MGTIARCVPWFRGLIARKLPLILSIVITGNLRSFSKIETRKHSGKILLVAGGCTLFSGGRPPFPHGSYQFSRLGASLTLHSRNVESISIAFAKMPGCYWATLKTQARATAFQSLTKIAGSSIKRSAISQGKIKTSRPSTKLKFS